MIKILKEKTSRNILLATIHIGGWVGFFIISIISAPDFHEGKPPDILSRLLFTIEIVIFFYINYLVLMPKFFTKRKFSVYLMIVLVLIVVFSAVGELNFLLHHEPPHDEPMMHRPPRFDPFRGLFVYFIILIISSGIRMTQEWIKNERQKKELENDKLKAELASLKSQLNPHFIFNVLNNICSLARKKSDQTEEVIIKLSQLLRYNLYNFEDDKVYLNEDIQYLRDYIDIQKMRLQDNVELSFDVKGLTENIRIEPLLFIPFIENAFKHGVNNINQCRISIAIDADPKQVHLIVKNYIFDENKPKEKYEGIGLNNAYRRLNLLYPGKYDITVVNKKPEYIVDLTIHLDD